MANDDFFDALDAAEAAQTAVGKKILESKQEKKVRYWYEEGYVPGNEKDSGDEEDVSNVCYPREGEGGGNGENGGAGQMQPLAAHEEAEPEEAPDSDADSSASSTVYEEVKIGSGLKHRGRKVRWGGIHGKLALADETSTTLAKYDEVMDELLLPGGASLSGARSSDDPGIGEVDAIVLAQVPQSGRSWSYNYSSVLAIEDEQREEDFEATKMRYAIEDGSENLQVRNEEEHAMAQWTKTHELARRQKRMELVQEIKKEQAKKRSIERGASEQLPGTRRPLALSQAWQERRAESGAARPAPRPSGRSMLPCSLAGGGGSSQASSSSGSRDLRSEQRLTVGQSKNWALRSAPGAAQLMRESVLHQTPDREPEDDGPQPEFRVPKRHVPKFVTKR